MNAPEPQAGNAKPKEVSGVAFALPAFLLWGLMPLLWKAMDHIDPLEVTAHRAFWSLPVAGLILIAIGRTGDIVATLKSPKKVAILFVCSVLISVNWGIFIWAIAQERTIESAFAYYINPLMNIVLGAIFLGERFNKLQMVSIALAALAVLVLAVAAGGLPWISLVLASTFSVYGLLRKTADVGPTQGFLVEIILVAGLAGAFILWLGATHQASFLSNTNSTLLLLLAGPGTALPLILHAAGAKRLTYSTLGLMQYITPNMIFLIGIFVFGEPLGMLQLVAFALIWTALGIYTYSFLRA